MNTPEIPPRSASPAWSGIHHIALIASSREAALDFYAGLLGFRLIAETYRAERESWKLDLEVPGGGRLEIFTFTGTPPRPDQPEARGLRHLAFAVPDVAAAAASLADRGVAVEPIRVDPLSGAPYTFFRDPDGLPLELYEAPLPSETAGAPRP